MTSRVFVGTRDDFTEDGDRKFVAVEDTSVGVIYVDGEFYALENRCAHQDGPVCDGMVKPALVGDHVGVGEHIEEKFADYYSISCPYHGWEYDIRTGEHLGDREIRITTYEVIVTDDSIYVAV